MSESRKGKPGHPRSLETRQKMSESQKKIIRGPLTEESIRKRTETRKLRNSASKRKPRSEETKRKLSEINLAKPLVICPHCNLSSKNKSNMDRYHFNNCKSYS